MSDSILYREILFLTDLARVECLSAENPVIDGASLVVRLSHENKVCEAMVEVRLPGTVNELGEREPTANGRLMVILQNAGDESIRLRLPEFMLTSGLILPWKVGLSMVTNIYRGELGESLCWQLALLAENDLELLAIDVSRILAKGRLILVA